MVIAPTESVHEVAALLAEAQRRVIATDVTQPAGYLAVVDVQGPDGVGVEMSIVGDAGPEPAAGVFDVTLGRADGKAALAAFDPNLGHYLILLPPMLVSDATSAMEDLASRLAKITVRCGRYPVRPAVGVGLVALTGCAEDPSEAGVTLDLALSEAVHLAECSRIERGLRAYVGQPDGPPHVRARGVRARLARRYFQLSAARRAWALTAASVMMAWVLPFGAYAAVFELLHVDLTTPLFWIVFVAVVLTAATVYAEALLALRAPRLPAADPPSWPPASAVIVAYLPNETDTIYSTVRSLLAQDYPGPLQVVLAYNTPEPLPVEQDLVDLAALDQRLLLVRVGDSTSKAQNINAALQVTTGEFIGIFDSDHRPMPTAFRRAARWLASGVEVVQGRSVVRNGSTNWLGRMVAVEFEGIYAVAHPGRAALHGFGIFGGSNGFWRADVLDRLRMRPDMLTEDIDISIRAIREGSRIAVDRDLISEELAPPTLMALWSQRIRWSQGWHQVSRRQLGRVWHSPAVSTRQRLGASFLLGWREIYAWVAAQMVPIMAFSLLITHDFSLRWLLPVFIVATVFASSIGPIQALFAWSLSVPQLRRRHRWWWHYILITGVLFGEFKGHVNRAAHLRELIGDRAWQVTPRARPARDAATTSDSPSGDMTSLTTMGPIPGTTATVALDRPCHATPILEAAPLAVPAHKHDPDRAA